MNDMGLEAPDADSAEQKQDAALEPTDDDERTPEPTEPPLEVNEADAQEQDQALDTGDDEYR
jgi:hypothetical protein